MTEYFGFREVPMSDEALAAFYQDKGSIDQTGWLANEYLIIENTDGTPVDQFRWDGQEFVHVPFKVINSRFMGKVKPRNIQQQLAVDMLYNSDITVKILVGKFGTGKDYLMSSAAIDLIEKGKYEKIVWVRNNIEVKKLKTDWASSGRL